METHPGLLAVFVTSRLNLGVTEAGSRRCNPVLGSSIQVNWSGEPLIFGIGESMSGVLVRVCGGLAMDSGAMVSLDIGRTACNWVGMWVGMLWGGVGCMGVRRKLRGRAWII